MQGLEPASERVLERLGELRVAEPWDAVIRLRARAAGSEFVGAGTAHDREARLLSVFRLLRLEPVAGTDDARVADAFLGGA